LYFDKIPYTHMLKTPINDHTAVDFWALAIESSNKKVVDLRMNPVY
jgi:hypothetical protein